MVLQSVRGKLLQQRAENKKWRGVRLAFILVADEWEVGMGHYVAGMNQLRR